jgi:hypothetical protein
MTRDKLAYLAIGLAIMICEPERTQDKAISIGSFVLWMTGYDRESMGLFHIGKGKTTLSYSLLAMVPQ